MSRTATIAQDESPVGRVDTFLRGWLTTNPGEMLPPELDLVDRLGVSRSTVRTVLKQLEAQGLVQCLGRRQGRRAATSRPQQRGVWAKTVLVISPALDPAKYARTGWLEAIEAGAMDALRQQGLYGLLMDSAGIPDILADAQRLPLGALAVRAADPAHTVLPLHRAGVTTAVFGTQAELAAIDQVYTDQAAGCQLLCDYLITQRGRKRLLRLWTPQDNPWWLRLRDEGYARAIAAAGLTPLPIVNVPPAVTNGKPLEELHDKIRIYTGFLAEYLLGPEPVDSILATTDRDVFAVVAALRTLGKRPQVDVDVVGYDNFWDMCEETSVEPIPPLASIDKQNDRVGREMVRLMSERIAGPADMRPRRVAIPPQLIIRAHA